MTDSVLEALNQTNDFIAMNILWVSLIGQKGTACNTAAPYATMNAECWKYEGVRWVFHLFNFVFNSFEGLLLGARGRYKGVGR